MQLTGKIVGLSTNYLTGTFELTVAVNESSSLKNGYEELQGEDFLDICLKKHQKKRSLDANAYFHVLVDKLADKLGISKSRCKNLMIGRYGQPFYIDDFETAEAVIKTNIPISQMLENELIHCMPCGRKTEDGQEITYYKVFRGSSTYNTKEMSVLIDGTIDECKEQGIETLSQAELERMMTHWKA